MSIVYRRSAVTILSLCAVLLFGQVVYPATSTIGTTEDAKALGYPDTRKLVRDSSGNLYAAFRKKYNSWYQVFVAKSTDDGTTWNVPSSPVSVVVGSFHQRVPSIAIDSADNLHVVWYGQDTTHSGANERQIKYSRSSDGGTTWTGWQNIAPVEGYTSGDYWQEHPVLYIDDGDNLYVVWEGRDASHTASSQAKFTKSTDGGINWWPWSNVSALSTNQSRPTMVVDSNGQIFVIAYGYWQASGKQNILFATSSNGGASFSTWSAVSASSSYEQRHPSAAIDSGNKIHLVWRQQDSGTSGKTVIKYSKSTSPAWVSSATISATATYYQFFPSIANANGSQYVVWTETKNTSGYPSEEPSTGRIVMAKRLQGATNWTKTNITSVANNVWGSIRWSSHNLNGGNVDIVYSSGSASPFSLKYQSFSPWGQ